MPAGLSEYLTIEYLMMAENGNWGRDWAGWALDTAAQRGADYADVRVVSERHRAVSTKNGKAGTVADSDTLGVGIRVVVDGAWGFAATDRLTRAAIDQTAAHAVAIARASASVSARRRLRLAPVEAYRAVWVSPCAQDPFAVPVDQNLALLLAVDKELRAVEGVTLAEAEMVFRRTRQLFCSTLGSEIDQTRVVSGAGYTATSFGDNEIQRRSYPNSFGGQFQLQGYELIPRLRLAENARRVGEEAVALHRAAQCPQMTGTVILDSSQLGLQIHESIGHPIELDRVLGTEANFAGMSFLTLDQLGHLRYGSDLVNVVADATLDHGPGLGTFAFDDEGVPAQRTDIIRRGQFVGYISSRETAPEIGQAASNGCMRAESWNRLPLIRMTNISIVPGDQPLSPEELIADTDQGVYMETNRSWSIDDKRYHFQFGCEAGWEIRHGKRTRLLKNPSYSGITTEFWNSMDAICSRDQWTLWGTPNCGKGQPQQVMGTGHGAAPARFRNVKIGTAYQK
ncbi:MAG: TldD/PmbA family protein [Terriglobales bacterium]